MHREVFVDPVVDPLRGLEPSPIKEITGGFELHVLTAGGSAQRLDCLQRWHGRGDDALLGCLEDRLLYQRDT